MNKTIIQLAIQEDLGTGDLSSELIPADQESSAILISREDAVLCGKEYFNEVFREIDAQVKIHWNVSEGETIQPKQELCELQGNARSILSAERCALNFLQTLSGTATTTHHYEDLIKHTKAKLLDTRKTIPGLREAQKYAVTFGGGHNHRMGLYDAVMIKENHIAAVGSITEAVKQSREKRPNITVIVEVENITELEVALAVKVKHILLDNFSLELLREAVALNNGQAKLEASGNITEENICEIAETGVDYISIGALTKNLKAVDFSLQFST